MRMKNIQLSITEMCERNIFALKETAEGEREERRRIEMGTGIERMGMDQFN